MKRAFVVPVVLLLAACSSPKAAPPAPVPSPSVVPSPTPTPDTIAADGYYVTLPLPVASSDHPNTVDLSTYAVIKAGSWSVPGGGCAVTVFDAAGYASAQSNNPVKTVVGPVTLKLPTSSLIYTHGCDGMVMQ